MTEIPMKGDGEVGGGGGDITLPVYTATRNQLKETSKIGVVGQVPEVSNRGQTLSGPRIIFFSRRNFQAQKYIKQGNIYPRYSVLLTLSKLLPGKGGRWGEYGGSLLLYASKGYAPGISV